MILAAGRGTRLEPLSNLRPKPLFPVLNRPLLGVIMEQLEGMGVREIVINTHHLAEKVVDFVRGRRWGLTVEVRVEPEILGTGGGVKNCADFLGDVPFFLLVNADIYHTFDLNPVVQYHREENNLATLVLCDDPRLNQVGLNGEGRIVSVRGKEVQKSHASARILTFTGIHIISSEIFGYTPSEGCFDIIGLYIDLASRGKAIKGYQAKEGYWRDIGRVEDYRTLHRDLLGEETNPVIHPTAQIGEGVRMEGVVCVGRGSHIGAGSLIKDSILWEEVSVKEGSVVEGCVVGDGTQVGGERRGEVLTQEGKGN